MSKQTTFLRLSAIRIALALAVAGVALVACGDAAPTLTPIPLPAETSVAQESEQTPGCEGGACLSLVEWPSFEATYEYEGAIKRIQWAGLDDWRVETLSADSITTAYGKFSPAGSWEQQCGSTYREYDAITGITSTETYEPNAYISPDGITPLLASLYEFPKSVNAPIARTETEVCYLEKCTEQTEGLRLVARPHLDAIVTNDAWRIPLKNGGLRMLQLTIHAEREMPQEINQPAPAAAP